MAFFKEGQTVYCALFGKGVVQQITKDIDFPIEVEINGKTKSYTSDGRYQKNYLTTLSQKPIPEIVNKHLPEFNLTFAEAMEAVYEGKSLQYEFGDDTYIKLHEDDVIYFYPSLKSPFPSSRKYYIEKEEIKGKWRIVE